MESSAALYGSFSQLPSFCLFFCLFFITYFFFFSRSSHSFVFGQRKALTPWLVPGFRCQLFLKFFMVRWGQGEKESTRRAYRVARPVSYLLHPPHVPCALIMLTFTPLAVFFPSTSPFFFHPFLLFPFYSFADVYPHASKDGISHFNGSPYWISNRK